MDPMAFTWTFWLLGFFLAYELIAVVCKWRTLSEQFRNWFSLGQRKRYWLARRIIFVVFGTALIYGHLLLHGAAWWSVVVPGVPFALVIGLSTFVWKDATTTGPPAERGLIMPEKYSWLTGILKGLQNVGEYAAAIALCAGVDALVTKVDSAEELHALGVPAIAVGTALFGVRMFVNWWKVRRLILAQGQLTPPKE